MDTELVRRASRVDRGPGRMTHLTQAEIANWIAVYVAVGLCCLIAKLMSVGVLAIQLVRERTWAQVRDLRSAVLFVPRTWWRWQKLYFLSTPVTLAIVGWFSATLTWS